MGLLMLAGLIGTVGYMAHFAKNETRAMIADGQVKPTGNIYTDKRVIEDNFKLICKRCNIKLDFVDELPKDNHYKVAIEYLKFQGFQKEATNHFEKIFLDKYNEKEKKEIQERRKRMNRWSSILKNDTNKKRTVYRKYLGHDEEFSKRISQNYLWHKITQGNYNLVKDGYNTIEVWNIYAPQRIINNLDQIYDDVVEHEKEILSYIR